MKLNYFKTKVWGDCYVGDENLMRVITISKDSVFLMADDEGMFEGFYKPLEVSRYDYNQLKKFAEFKDRKNLVNLLKKVHEENSEALKSHLIMRRITNIEDIDNPDLKEKQISDFFNKEPILE
jgi:hypothetical protein